MAHDSRSAADLTVVVAEHTTELYSAYLPVFCGGSMAPPRRDLLDSEAQSIYQ